MWSRAEDGRSVLWCLRGAAVAACAMLPPAGQAAPLDQLNSLKLEVPTSDALLTGGKGADVVNNNCLACHSADHLLNQPSLSKTTWEEIVNKMIQAYKAPISPADAAAVVDYLTRAKGQK
jgi:mono/diheme cytochrome c family protein